MNNIAISVENLNYKIGEKEILKNINFKIKKGEFVGIIGPNGAGKSTLIKIIVGEIKSYTGQISVNGKIGYLPQVQTINREVPINALQFAKMGAYKKKVSKEQISTLLKNVGLAGKERQLVGTMSGGELQRLSLARALLYNPDILILDEPEAGVDQMGKARFYELLYKVKEKKNLTILMISHDIGMVFEKCTSVMCLNKTLHCHGPTEKIKPDELKILFPDFDLWLRAKNHYEREHENGDI
ncbi:metal ABC transporter ATP-binding protein [Thermosipho sp. 1063]|uniref:metal ABC transporter ATP-binding protein n=1 Tax=unclassified Thermosipho (in: thermotogales) TaxID=2676525 RepID=UPI0009494AF9|nr:MULTISPECIES: metal ABC transporter ATP-binding protein [unclassified Thermosipho (in: thermotogales)]ANQ53465.1 metal ABC transporter ATP-binding protein [Thermosipho sp. 1070]APT71914.1 metal ABC transporter ATP-binding protein [Thermosipho sp. 1063]OOC44846.1 metal ABC transporter ATP-binding protein [Thermosipho sp. 1074]